MILDSSDKRRGGGGLLQEVPAGIWALGFGAEGLSFLGAGKSLCNDLPTRRWWS